MRKNELIKLLQGIEGNPEVRLWNPYVEDYNPILDVQVDTLYKESASFIFECLKAETYQREKRWELTSNEVELLEFQAKQIHKEREYGLPNEYVTEKEKDRWYQKRTKSIIVLSPKKVGKTSCGRHKYEDIEY